MIGTDLNSLWHILEKLFWYLQHLLFNTLPWQQIIKTNYCVAIKFLIDTKINNQLMFVTGTLNVPEKLD